MVRIRVLPSIASMVAVAVTDWSGMVLIWAASALPAISTEPARTIALIDFMLFCPFDVSTRRDAISGRRHRAISVGLAAASR